MPAGDHIFYSILAAVGAALLTVVGQWLVKHLDRRAEQRAEQSKRAEAILTGIETVCADIQANGRKATSEGISIDELHRTRTRLVAQSAGLRNEFARKWTVHLCRVVLRWAIDPWDSREALNTDAILHAAETVLGMVARGDSPKNPDLGKYADVVRLVEEWIEMEEDMFASMEEHYRMEQQKKRFEQPHPDEG